MTGGGVKRDGPSGVSAALLRHAGVGAAPTADFDRLRREATAGRSDALLAAFQTDKRAKHLERRLDQCRRAVAAAPGSPRARFDLARALHQTGNKAEAAEAYRQAIALGYDAPSAEYFLAALGARPTPAASPQAYVARLFDGYAEAFEGELIGALKYAIPELAQEMLAEALAPRAASLAVFDAGCGTGLAGERLRAWAHRLDGADLSAGMLAKARAKRIYDTLAHGDFTAVLAARPGAYDLVVAADVMIYFGDLRPVFAAVRRGLKRGGHFLFSVEHRASGDGFTLEASGRYAHAPAYVARAAREAGLDVIAARDCSIRFEAGAAVPGGLYLCGSR